MVKIKRRTVQLVKFNARIYKKEAIKKAILIFSSLSSFKITDSKDYISVVMDIKDFRLKDILPYEFSNYVLGMTKRCL